MEISLLIEPFFSGTYWCVRYLKGIRHEAAQNGVALREIDIQAGDGAGGRTVIVVGSSMGWIPKTLSFLAEIGTRVVLVSSLSPDLIGGVSTVTIDYEQAVSSLVSYFRGHGRRNIALLGINPNSTGDASKLRAFSGVAVGADPSRSVFKNLGSVENCCSRFMERSADFDAVIACSDIIAIHLLRRLKATGIIIPGSLMLASFGDTVLGSLVRPGITSISLDCFNVGRQAVKLCMLLDKNPSLTSLSATVAGSLTVRDSTGGLPVPCPSPVRLSEFSEAPPVDFYADEAVKRIFDLERLVSQCDEIDFGILGGLFSGSRYFALSEELDISENTVKYRIKRMIGLSRVSGRDELLALVGDYLDFTKSNNSRVRQ